jgi:integrase/recombinase XerD
MATIYKMDGRPNLMIAWFDGSGKRCVRSAGTTDRRVAEKLAAKLESAATLRREGLVDPRAEGIVQGSRCSITELVVRFCEFLKHKGNGDQHVVDREAQLMRLVETMKIDRIAYLTPAKVQAGIAKLRTERGIALNTANRYLVAIKAFSRWLMREGLAPSDPLAALSRFRAETDRRHVRRALTALEVQALVEAAERGTTSLGLSGRDRAALYRLAVGTGFRASEIASLTKESFDLDGSPPTITVKAAYSKNRSESVQPIRRDLAELLRPWLETKPTGAPVFDVKGLRYRTALWMRRDLTVAGLAYQDAEGGIADFHALRHTYITEVVRAGASVKEAQTLARHKTPDLTFRVYAHARLQDLERTLERLPITIVAHEAPREILEPTAAE